MIKKTQDEKSHANEPRRIVGLFRFKHLRRPIISKEEAVLRLERLQAMADSKRNS